MGLQGRTRTAIQAAMFSALLLGFGLACAGAGVETSAIRVSVLPDASEQRLRNQYAPLVEYLAETTGYEIELVLSPGYESLLDEFDAGRVDLAWFGGLTFVRAHARSGAEALVTRDVDVAFTSDFIARSGGNGSELEALRGASFAFGPRLSTSGHLMPRALLAARGIVAEEFFTDVRYSNGHDESIQWVRDDVVDLAAVNSATLQSMIDDASVAAEAMQVVASTGPYQNYVWATRPGLRTDTRMALREAFLALDASEPACAPILRRLQAGGYLPIDSSAYEQLKAQASSLGLLAEAQ